MSKYFRCLFFFAALTFPAPVLLAQSGSGTLDIFARVTPTGARPEPVRQFTLYILSKSYAEISKEIEGKDVFPSQEEFIEKWNCSAQLKEWMKAQKIVDLNSVDLDKLITPADVMKIPEFFDAYQRSNSGGVTSGLPQPKFREADKQDNPAKYEKEHNEWLTATRKFIEGHPYTIQGMELELSAVNPRPAWEKLQNEHRRSVAQLAPDTAQMKYLVAKADTDLEGRAVINGLRPGTYWVSSLGLDAAAGDRRLVWDVPAKIAAGQTTHLELSNLNGSILGASTGP